MYMERLLCYKQFFLDSSILLFQKIESFAVFLKVWSTIPAIYWKYKDDAFKLYYVNCSANNSYHPTTLLFDFFWLKNQTIKQQKKTETKPKKPPQHGVNFNLHYFTYYFILNGSLKF